jgi:LysR family cys regulon transcriptional activator
MRLEQLRFLCEVAHQGFSISRAAEALHTTQPNVSKQVRALERELDAELLRRNRGRVVGLTAAGAAVMELAGKVMRDTQRIAAIPAELNETGELTIATTHLHARYVLPRVLERFKRQYPRMQITMLQSEAEHAVDLVRAGEADLGITSRPPGGVGDLARYPCFDILRSLIVPPKHPLLRAGPLTLERIAEHPLVCYHRTMPGGRVVMEAFARRRIHPRVAISASDSEIVKTYVRLGFGVAVLPTLAFDRTVDRALRAIDVGHLFERSTVEVLVRGDLPLSSHMRSFIDLLVPHAPEAKALPAAAASGPR